MAYDFFSQPQGPNIDVHLFEDAAIKGAQLGRLTPSTTTSVIQGVTEGLKTGMDLYGQYEQNRLRSAQATNEETIAQINQMKLETEQVTQENEILIAKQEAENKLKAVQAEKNDTENLSKISQDLNSTDPNVRASVLTNYGDILLRKKDVREYVLGRLGPDQELPPAARQMALGLQDYNKREDDRLKQAQIDAAQRKSITDSWEKIEAKANANAEYGNALRTLGIKNQASDIARIEFVSRALVDTGPDGKLVLNRNKDIADPTLTLASGYVALKDGVLVPNLVVGKETDDVLGLYKNYYSAKGFDMNPKPPVTAQGTPQASPTPEGKPYLERFSSFLKDTGVVGGGIAPTSPSPNATPSVQPTPPPQQGQILGDTSNGVVNARGQAVLEKAQPGTPLRQALIARGVLLPEPTPNPYVPVPSAALPPSFKQNAAPVSTPVPVMTPEEKAQKINYTVSTLPPDVRKNIDKKVISKVLDDPLLAGLDPIFQAVAAYESRGERGAKGKGSSAQGLFQVTTDAATDVNKKRKDKLDVSTPEGNVVIGKAYLEQFLTDYHGAEVPALFAYNMGPGVAKEAFAISGSPDYADLVNALRYIKEKRAAPENVLKILDRSDFEANLKYPLRVLAYKEAFKGLANA